MLKKRERELLMIGRTAALTFHDCEPADLRILHRLWNTNFISFVGRNEDDKPEYQTNIHGEAALRRPAPPPKPGRVNCMNPVCGSTGSVEKFPNGMICGRCFKSTGELRLEVKALEARRRKVERLSRKHGRDSAALATLDARLVEVWSAIERYFQAPDRIEGLEAFLKEMGWEKDEDLQNRQPQNGDPERGRGGDGHPSEDDGDGARGDRSHVSTMGRWTGGTHWSERPRRDDQDVGDGEDGLLDRASDDEGDDDEPREDEDIRDGQA